MEVLSASRGQLEKLPETPNVEVTGAARLYRAASVLTAGLGATAHTANRKRPAGPKRGALRLQASTLIPAFNLPAMTMAHISVLNCSILAEGGCGSDSTEVSPSRFVKSTACCGSMLPPNANM